MNQSPLHRPGTKKHRRHACRGLLAWTVFAASAASAQSLTPVGCPVFHCTPEATGVMAQPLVQATSTVTINNSLGTMQAQGCSGNGAQLACLFQTDNETGAGKGTLKWIDATSLQPIWGSAAAPNSYNLNAASSAGGQMPVLFADGSIAAGDRYFHVHYDASGAVIGKVALDKVGSNFGLTPISDTRGVVTQTDGVLTLINLTTWQTAGTLQLVDMQTGAPMARVVSPSSSSSGVLYVVAVNAQGQGYLLSVVANPSGTGLRQRNQFVYDGPTGASAVVVSKAISSLPTNLLLLHVPGLNGDGQNRLLGLKDNPTAGGFMQAWSLNLAQPLQVAPTIDATTQSLYFVDKGDPNVYQVNYLTGVPGNTYDMRAYAALPSDFGINGHLGAMQTGSTFTMLLSGSVATTPGQIGEYMVAFKPSGAPASALWSVRTSGLPDQFTAAWDLGPSSRPGSYCPIVVGKTNGLTRVCDF